MYKRIAAFAKGGYFVYFFSIRKADSLYGKAPPEGMKLPNPMMIGWLVLSASFVSLRKSH
jgi:hypothetical protein